MNVDTEWPDPDRREAALDRAAGIVLADRPRRSKPTTAELRVVSCLSHGMTVRMAADTLGVTYHTAWSQIREARRRMAAKNSTHAVAIAIRNGWID